MDGPHLAASICVLLFSGALALLIFTLGEILGGRYSLKTLMFLMTLLAVAIGLFVIVQQMEP